MSIYATGRTRTVKLEGTFSGEMAFSWDGFPSGEGYNKNFLISVDAFCVQELPPPIRNFGFTIASNLLNFGSGWSLAGTEISYSAQMGDFGDGGPGTSTSGTISYDPWSLTNLDGGLLVTGSYSFQVEAAEYFELASVPVGPDFLEDGYPKWGDNGNPYFRGMPASAIRFFERVETGAAASLTVTAGSLAINLSSTVPVGFDLARGVVVTAAAEGFAQNTTLPGGTCSVTVPEGYNYDFSYSGSGVNNSSSTDNGCSVSHSGAITDGSNQYNYASISRAFLEPTEYKWNIKNFRYGEEMAGSTLTWKIYDEGEDSPSVELGVNGSAERSITQYQESISTNISGRLEPPGSGGVDTFTFDNISYLGARIKGTSLADLGEDEDNWRCWLHGKAYDAMNLEHSSLWALTNTTTTGWTGSGGLTLGAGLSFTTGASSGYATRTFSEVVNSEGYRYLKVKCSSSTSGQTFKIQIGSKTWNCVTGPAARSTNELVLDMCCSDNDIWIVDTCSTRYPLDWNGTLGIAGAPLETTEAWGINEIPELIVSVPASSNLIISEIALHRTLYNKISFIANLKPEMLLWEVDKGNETWGWTNIYASADGRCFDLADQYHVKPDTGDPLTWYYVHYSIAQQAGLFETIDGYIAQYGTEQGYEYPDEYHTDQLNSFFLGGAGYLANYSASVNWQVQDNVDVTVSTLKAQPLYDWVRVYPGAGDVFGGSAFDIPTPVAAHWHSRGRVQGICYTSNRKPATATITSTPDRGSATTDAIGTYFTDGPYVKQSESSLFSASNLPSSGVTVSLTDGAEQRICWRGGGEVLGAIDYTIRPNRHHFRLAATDQTGTIGTAGEDLLYQETPSTAKRITHDQKSIIELRENDGAWSIHRNFEG